MLMVVGSRTGTLKLARFVLRSKAQPFEHLVILKIDGTDVHTLEEVTEVHARAIANVDQKHRIMFVVLRNGLMRQIVLDFSRDHSKD